ncbi:MAG: type II toxin-antitoxin system Phd/YefM family antitoxin [Spirochaetota bacterium]
MKRASITETKNNLSKLIEEVKNGNSILIMDRKTPVARMEPVDECGIIDFDRSAGLVRRGIASYPRHSLELETFLSRDKVKLPAGRSAVQVLVEERGESL